jgi:hypothetical protein
VALSHAHTRSLSGVSWGGLKRGAQ